ncbi:hypothetical protein BEL04_13260 [Mucilaginibacter sp. PPCGB 2223]|uniref:hypothetical protein n=1 Tax=Mucilaginibacter sp. PPCGB 2223 TaxID=1886027 RepID=UPI0008241769|nr:hypothetical protein [Mucilaginibacter sp. PPCGB 2223]OCX52428.1 hypothetical protein BEL04_13260 [Mucilaginibacter sp. PPCGB 2223]
MKKLLALLPVIFTTCTVLAQRSRPKYPPPPTHPPTKAEQKAFDYHNDCVHRDTYTAAQRLRFYPFNKAAKVILVSFYGPLPPMEPADTVPPYYRPLHGLKLPGFDTIGKLKYPFDGKNVDYSAFMEQVTLTKNQVNKLTDIFYNINIRGTPLPPGMLDIADPGASCFNPRNAVLFVDANGNTFAYIEICFECERVELYPEKLKMWEWCDDKWGLVRNYFASAGIRWGVTVLNRRTYKHKKVEMIKKDKFEF